MTIFRKIAATRMRFFAERLGGCRPQAHFDTYFNTRTGTGYVGRSIPLDIAEQNLNEYIFLSSNGPTFLDRQRLSAAVLDGNNLARISPASTVQAIAARVAPAIPEHLNFELIKAQREKIYTFEREGVENTLDQPPLLFLKHPEQAVWGENFFDWGYYALRTYAAYCGRQAKDRAEYDRSEWPDFRKKIWHIFLEMAWRSSRIEKNSPAGMFISQISGLVYGRNRKLEAELKKHPERKQKLWVQSSMDLYYKTQRMSAHLSRQPELLPPVKLFYETLANMISSTTSFGRRAFFLNAVGDEGIMLEAAYFKQIIAGTGIEEEIRWLKEFYHDRLPSNDLAYAYGYIANQEGDMDQIIASYLEFLFPEEGNNISQHFSAHTLGQILPIDQTKVDRRRLTIVIQELDALATQGFTQPVDAVRKALGLNAVAAPVPVAGLAESDLEPRLYLYHRDITPADLDLAGQKAVNLAVIKKELGLAVPPFFCVTSPAVQSYLTWRISFSRRQISGQMAELEKETGLTFGAGDKSLFVSVRSGGKFSLPGCLETILNVGLNDITVKSLARRFYRLLAGPKKTTDESRAADRQARIKLARNLAYSTYLKFIIDYGVKVLSVAGDSFAGLTDDLESLSLAGLKERLARAKEIIKAESGLEFPQDVNEQLTGSLEAVAASWNSPNARLFRFQWGLPQFPATAVTVQEMKFGQAGSESFSGVIFSRNPQCGFWDPEIEIVRGQGDELMGRSGSMKKLTEEEKEYLSHVKNACIYSGNVRMPQPLAGWEVLPGIVEELIEISNKLEKHFRDAREDEFTVEGGSLFILQDRSLTRSALAAGIIANDLASSRIIGKKRAAEMLTDRHLLELAADRFDPSALAQSRPLVTGLGVSPGDACGLAAFSLARVRELAAAEQKAVFFKKNFTNDDYAAMSQSAAAAAEDHSVHSQALALKAGLPMVKLYQNDLTIDEARGELRRTDPVTGQPEVLISEGDPVSLSGQSGLILAGFIPLVESPYKRLIANPDEHFHDEDFYVDRYGQSLRDVLQWRAGNYEAGGTITTRNAEGMTVELGGENWEEVERISDRMNIQTEAQLMRRPEEVEEIASLPTLLTNLTEIKEKARDIILMGFSESFWEAIEMPFANQYDLDKAYWNPDGLSLVRALYLLDKRPKKVLIDALINKIPFTRHKYVDALFEQLKDAPARQYYLDMLDLARSEGQPMEQVGGGILLYVTQQLIRKQPQELAVAFSAEQLAYLLDGFYKLPSLHVDYLTISGLVNEVDLAQFSSFLLTIGHERLAPALALLEPKVRESYLKALNLKEPGQASE